MTKWTCDEIELLKNNSMKTKEELQLIFPNRTVKSIIHKIANMSLPRQTVFKKYTNDEDGILIENSEKSKEELLMLLPNRNWESIRSRIDYLRLPRNKGWSFWTEDEIDILLECETKEEAISKLPDRNINMINSKANKIGKSFYNESYWTDEETNILISKYSKMPVNNIMKLVPSKSRIAIYIKANRLGLKNYIYREDVTEDIVISMYVEDDMLIKDIAKELNMSESKVSSLIPEEISGRRYKVKIEQAINMYKSGIGSETIAKKFNTHASCILKVLKKNGIKLRKIEDYFQSYRITLDIVEISKLYQEGISAAKIAEMFNTTANTIVSRLKEAQVEIRPTSFYISGEKSPNWKGGITPDHLLMRSSKEYKNWRKEVFGRDDYTCKCCGDNTGGNLQAHHIVNFAEHEDIRLDVDNGITLCEECHSPSKIGSFHHVYGTRNNTREQLDAYILNHKQYQGKFKLTSN